MNEQIKRYQDLVRAIIKKLTGSYNEDLEQEVYIKAWQNREKYSEEGKSEAWLGVLAASTVKDYFKSRVFKSSLKTNVGSEQLEKVGVANHIEEKIDAKHRQKIILKAVDALPSK